MADEIGKIITAVGSILGLFLLVIFAISIISNLGEQQCQPYKNTIVNKEGEISTLQSLNAQTEGQLNQCKTEYDTLIHQNITKKDFEEIKGYYNTTQIQINNLDLKFEQLTTNYNNFYKVLLNNYRLSLTINIAIGVTLLGVEILSLAFLKSEFVMFTITAIIKHRKKKKEEHESHMKRIE